MTERSRPPKFHQARVVLLLSLFVTALLYFIPQAAPLAYPFMLLSTVAHEMGHGISALLIGGAFHRFEIWMDGSGVAQVSTPDHALARAFVAAGGLIGPAVAAALGFTVGRNARGARRCLLALALVLLLSIILVVRGFFGIFFVAFVAFGCALVALKAVAEIAQMVLVFLAVQLALSVFSRSDYLFMATAQTSGGTMPSDAGQIAAALWLPYWFWGGLCGGVSVLALAYGLKVFWRR